MPVTGNHLFFKYNLSAFSIYKDMQTHGITLFGVQRHGASGRDFTRSGHPVRKGYMLDIGQEEAGRPLEIQSEIGWQRGQPVGLHRRPSSYTS